MSQPGEASPFRSTIALSRRRRQRPMVERSTFVIVSCGAQRLAIAAELVERVLRAPDAAETVPFAGAAVPVVDLATCLGAPMPPDGPETRLLVVRLPRPDSPLLALRVQAVHEVHAVETATVEAPGPGESDPPPAACGRFTRRDLAVWVLDLGRLPERA